MPLNRVRSHSPQKWFFAPNQIPMVYSSGRNCNKKKPCNPYFRAQQKKTQQTAWSKPQLTYGAIIGATTYLLTIPDCAGDFQIWVTSSDCANATSNLPKKQPQHQFFFFLVVAAARTWRYRPEPRLIQYGRIDIANRLAWLGDAGYRLIQKGVSGVIINYIHFVRPCVLGVRGLGEQAAQSQPRSNCLFCAGVPFIDIRRQIGECHLLKGKRGTFKYS